MATPCPEQIFAEVRKLLGKHQSLPDSILEFCSNVIATDMGYLSELYIPDLDFNTAPLDDWFDFEDWCDDLTPGLMHQIFGNEAFSETHLPRHFFNDSSALKKALLPKLMEQEDAFKYSCGVVEVEHNDEVLALVFTDLDGWNVESGNLLVTRNYEELTEQNRFFSLNDEDLVDGLRP